MKNTYFKLISILLIVSISVSFVFMLPRRAQAGFVDVLVITVLIASAVVVDYISCRINVLFDAGCYPGDSVAQAVLTPNFNEAGVCTFKASMDFYLPPGGLTEQKCNPPDSDGNQYCWIENADLSQRQIAIYRFTLPAGSSNAAINDWYLSLSSQVGQGIGKIETINRDFNYICGGEAPPIAVVPYSSICSGNTCGFNDTNIPPNVYVAYIAKILGNFIAVNANLCPYDFSFNYFSGGNVQNLFLSKDNKWADLGDIKAATLPYFSGTTYIIGNTFWLFKTGSDADCPSPPPPPPGNFSLGLFQFLPIGMSLQTITVSTYKYVLFQFLPIGMSLQTIKRWYGNLVGFSSYR